MGAAVGLGVGFELRGDAVGMANWIENGVGIDEGNGVGDKVDGGTPWPAEQEMKGYSTPLNSEMATVPGMVIADAVA